jgi:hypothetical protein
LDCIALHWIALDQLLDGFVVLLVFPVTLKQTLWCLVGCINVEALAASVFCFPATVLPK